MIPPKRDKLVGSAVEAVVILILAEGRHQRVADDALRDGIGHGPFEAITGLDAGLVLLLGY